MPDENLIKGLNQRQQMFCINYIRDFNGARSARDAGYVPENASQAASQLLRNPSVREYIAELTEEKVRATKIDAFTVLREVYTQQQAKIEEILDEDGKALPMHEWPDHWQKMVSSIEIQEQTEMVLNTKTDEFEKKVVARIIKFKSTEKGKLLELLGKHVDVKAFIERIEDGTEIEELDRRLKLYRNMRRNIVAPS